MRNRSTNITHRMCRQLLTHSAGLCYDLTNPLLVKWSASVGRKVNMFSGEIVSDFILLDLHCNLIKRVFRKDISTPSHTSRALHGSTDLDLTGPDKW